MTTKVLLIVLTSIFVVGLTCFIVDRIEDSTVPVQYSPLGGFGMFLMSGTGMIFAFLGLNTLKQKWFN